MCAVMHYYCGRKFPGISEILESDKIKHLQLCLNFLEAPNSKIKDTFSLVFNNKVINLQNERKISSIENTKILCYFIARSYISFNWESVDLSNCNIDDNCCKILYKPER